MKLNNRGASLLSVIGVSAAVSIGIWFLSDRISTQQKVSANLTEDVSYNLAIKSLTDYSIYFVKNQWCFDQQNPTSLQVPLPDQFRAQCADNYTHPFSTMRLMLPLDYAKTLFEQKNLLSNETIFPSRYEDMKFNENNLVSPFNLPGFTITADINNISDTNPVKQILKNIKGHTPVKSVRLYFLNEVDSTLPGSTGESYVRIVTQLLDNNGEIIKNGANFATETARMYVAPRENNYFSLILGGSIYVGKSDSATSDDVGSLYLPQASGEGHGINFYSPVFVQNDLRFMPNITKVPVTFHDTVVFGIGGVKGIPINLTLGDKKYWDDLNLFGGFKKNFEIDSKLDQGLITIANPSNTTSAESINQKLDMCIKLLRSKDDSLSTQQSQLYFYKIGNNSAAPITGNTFSRDYRLSFKYDQTGCKDGAPATCGVRKFFKTLPKPASEYQRLGKVEASNSKIEFQIMSPTSQTDLTLQPTNESSPIALYAAVKWKNNIIDFIPVLAPIDSTTTGTKILTTQFRLFPDLINKPDYFSVMNISLKKSPIIAGAEQVRTYKDISIEIKELNKLDNNPIEYIKIMAFDETCNYVGPQSGTPGTATGAECATNPGSGENKFVYIRKLTQFGTEPSNCLFDKPYSLSSMQDIQCASSSVIPIPNDNALDNELIVNYEGYFNSCFNSSILSLGNSSNEIDAKFIVNTYNGWEAFPNIAASSTPGFTGYANITFTNFNSTNPISGAIYNVCTVPANVGVVTGNFLCKELIIQQRNTPLDMIGTFIVTNKMIVHPSVYQYGLDFYNFHHSEAVNFLRERRILKPIDDPTTLGIDESVTGSCLDLPTPHWHPDPGLVNQVNRLNCSSSSVFKGTDIKYPFRWTSVTADCIHEDGSPNTKCIKRLRNYIYRSLERSYGRTN